MDVTIEQIGAYREKHWDEIVADIESMVRIASVEDLDAATDGAPYGPGPRKALDQALAIARRMGFETHDCEGRIGYADLPGESAMQVGIIGHVDVVAAGPGWTCEPYGVTRREGYLLGRGVIDDKGPLMVALHALKFWKDQGAQLPYTVRVLFGANEETNMKDVEYYRARHDDPEFLFTPDSQFPVGYGESGICSGWFSSAPIAAGDIVDIQGGQAVNAVPGTAFAVVKAAEGALCAREGIAVDPCGEGLFRIEAHGVSAHAMQPESGRNAIGMLVGYLLDNNVGNDREQAFMRVQALLHGDAHGSGFGLECSDEHFGSLTAVGGMVGKTDGVISQSIDVRYPTATSAHEIEGKIQDAIEGTGVTFEMAHDKAPFLMNPGSPAVQALLEAYRKVTGEDTEALTSKGGTYARCFTTGVSFGVEKPWEEDPVWVGGMHGPDEGVSEELLKESFSIYALALGKLMGIDITRK